MLSWWMDSCLERQMSFQTDLWSGMRRKITSLISEGSWRTRKMISCFLLQASLLTCRVPFKQDCIVFWEDSLSFIDFLVAITNLLNFSLIPVLPFNFMALAAMKAVALSQRLASFAFTRFQLFLASFKSATLQSVWIRVIYIILFTRLIKRIDSYIASFWSFFQVSTRTTTLIFRHMHFKRWIIDRSIK